MDPYGVNSTVGSKKQAEVVYSSARAQWRGQKRLPGRAAQMDDLWRGALTWTPPLANAAPSWEWGQRQR